MSILFSAPRVEEELNQVQYSDSRVRVGNWVQRNFKFIKHNIPKETMYMSDYKIQPVDMDSIEQNANLVSDRVMNSFGMAVADSLDDTNFATNYSTLYQLHYCRALANPKMVRDCTLNHVNTVNYGLGESKRKKWEFDRSFKDAYLSENKTSYLPHDVPRYGIRRESSDMEAAVNVCRMIVDGMEFKSNDERICFCPEHPKFCAIKPRNPINILPAL